MAKFVPNILPINPPRPRRSVARRAALHHGAPRPRGGRPPPSIEEAGLIVRRRWGTVRSDGIIIGRSIFEDQAPEWLVACLISGQIRWRRPIRAKYASAGIRRIRQRPI